MHARGANVVLAGLEPDELAARPLADALELRSDFTGSRFVLDGVEMRVPMPGAFNVLNALAAIHAARALGVSDATIAEALPRIHRVPGRFEPVDEGQDFAVIVDYSHTPDSLENVLTAARELAGDARVVCVFGCGGDRDRGKRPGHGAHRRRAGRPRDRHERQPAL